MPFEWWIDEDGYDLSDDGQRIVRRGGPMRAYRPDDAEPAPHYLFAQVHVQLLPTEVDEDRLPRAERRNPPFWARRFDSEPEALLAFVREFGFLGGLDHGADVRSETVDYIATQQRHLSVFYDFGIKPLEGSPVDSFNRHVVPDMTVRLEEDDDGARHVRVLPRTLLAWMYLQVAEEIAAGTTWAECRWCSKPFPRGGGRTRGVQRADASYCSPRCRTQFNNAERARENAR